MAIIAKASNAGGDFFAPAPQGVHRAICCDVVDRGLVAGKFGEKHQVRIVWQLETLMDDGRPYLIDRNYTLSLDERSALRHDLETWAGKPLTLEQAAGFDLEKLIGVTCTLLVVHKKGTQGDRVFANVSAVLPKQAGQPLAIGHYVRVIHRQQPPAQPKPVGPSFAPQPHGWPVVLPEPKQGYPAANLTPAPQPEPDAFGSAQVTAEHMAPMTADDIPFAWLLPLFVGSLGLLS